MFSLADRGIDPTRSYDEANEPIVFTTAEEAGKGLVEATVLSGPG